LEVAAQIGRSLQVQEPNFLTDSLILAQTLQRQDLTNNSRYRPNLHQFIHHTQGIQARIFKIKRENNTAAHRQAQEAVNVHSIEAYVYNCTKHPSDQCL
jgi:hypothetical protein